MSIFDKLKNTAVDAVKATGVSGQNKRETFTFAALPESLAEMQTLPEASLSRPFQTAALTVCALCAYAADKQIVIESNHTSNTEEGYVKLFIPCGGADSPRPIKLRRKEDGRWFCGSSIC